MPRITKHHSLFWQLVIPLLTVGILALAVTVYTEIQLSDSIAEMRDVDRLGNSNIINLEGVDITVAMFRTLSLKHLISESASEMKKLDGQLIQTRLEFTQKIDALFELFPVNHEDYVARIKLLKLKVTGYFDQMSIVLELSNDFEKESAFEWLNVAEQNHIAEINNIIKSLIRGQFSELMVSRDALESEISRYFNMTQVLGIGSVIMLMIVAFIVTRRIASRLQDVLTWSQRFSEDSSTIALRIDYDDEVGRLVVAMNEMANKITHAHTEILSAKKHAEEDAIALMLYANVFENSGEAILIADNQKHIIAINIAFTHLTGYSFEEVHQQDIGMLSTAETVSETYSEIGAALKNDGFWQGELCNQHKDGSIYPAWTAISSVPDENGEIINYIASFTDMSRRKAAEEKIKHLAHHDPLTGLLNRFSLEDRLAQAIYLARRDQVQLAVLFIDLDRFKLINDSYGHSVGDLLLIEVAQRLKSCMRESDILARLGGDEFVVVLTGLVNGAQAAPSVAKIATILSNPYIINNYDLNTSPSIGISIFPNDGNNPDELMKHADSAMYHAKSQGRNNYQFFSKELTEVAEKRLVLENDFRIAISKQQFELYYQPQFYTDNKQIYGFEALLRWHHPEKGIVSPCDFILHAEDSGLIEPLGTWVLDEACRQLSIWQKMDGGSSIRMAVNLSARQLRSTNLVKLVYITLEKYQLSAASLELEVTETIAMDDPEYAIKVLEELSALGVSISIDDFGTGYSSFTYLKRLPVHILKLDRSFVRDIETDINDAEISEATVSLAHNLGLKVVAEGVETEAQYEFLARHQCDFLQGFLFSEPLPADKATKFLSEY